MAKKLTRDIKIGACAYCENADQVKLRQHRPNYCDKFEAYNGHCKNFKRMVEDGTINNN